MTNKYKLRAVLLVLILVAIVLAAVTFYRFEVEYSGEYTFHTITSGGEITKYNAGDRAIKSTMFDRSGFITRGKYYRGGYYVIKDGILYKIDIEENTSSEYIDFKSVFRELLIPNRMVSLNEESIYLCYWGEREKPDKSYSLIYQFYRYDKSTQKVLKINIPNCKRAHMVPYKGRYFYTDNTSGEICYLLNGNVCRTGIYGEVVSISPDGRRLAYIAVDGISISLHIYNIATKTDQTITSYGMATVRREIEWSPDSNLIAVEEYTEFSPGEIYIICASTGSLIRIIKNSRARHWFFSDVNYIGLAK